MASTLTASAVKEMYNLEQTALSRATSRGLPLGEGTRARFPDLPQPRFLGFRQVVYFADEHEQVLRVLLHGSLLAQVHPAFCILHRSYLPDCSCGIEA